MIILVEESDPNWWEGSLNGKTGNFFCLNISFRPF